jgi:predicted neuraminidase
MDKQGDDPAWNSEAEVKVQKSEDRWRAVIAIPFRTIGVNISQIGRGAWRMNICRNAISEETKEKAAVTEYSTWIPVIGHSFYSPCSMILIRADKVSERNTLMRRKETIISIRQSGNKWQGIPGIERTSGGRLFVSWFSGGNKEPESENKVYLQISDDDGKTFSEPEVIADPPGLARAFDPTLWIDPRGVLWLIYNQGNAQTGEHGVFARLCYIPDAKKLVWTEPRRLGFNVPFSFRLNKPTVLSSGEWLMPVTWCAEEVKNWFAGSGQHQVQGVGVSRDQGQSWKVYGQVDAPPWALENMIMEKKDGTVLMFIRTGDGVIWQSSSHDGGKTWSQGSRTAIVNPGTRFFIRKLRSGRWLLINTPNPCDRKTMVACLSSDEGKTWSDGLMLDERDQVSYPDAIQAADGTIYAVHDRDRYGVGEVILSVFKESDILR